MCRITNNAICRKLEKHSLAVLSCVVTLLLVPCLAGCKNSDVLNELINDQEIGELDESLEPWYQEAPDAMPDPTRNSTYQSENDNLAQQEQTKAVYSQQQPTEPEEQAEQREQQDTPHDYEATEGKQEGEAGKRQEIASNDNGAGGGGQDESQNPTGGKGGTISRVDPDSSPAEIPRNVASVAAQGQEATIVQMLCGSGALVAANESWASTMLAKGAFLNEGLENVVSGWTDDGVPNISALVSAAPNAIIEESDSRALTAEELAAMAEQGLTCTVVTVSKLGDQTTQDSAIMSNVQVIGEMMQDANTQYSSSQMASQYKTMHDEAIDNCVLANGGYAYKVVNGNSLRSVYRGSGEDSTNFSSNRVATAVVDSWSATVSGSAASERFYANASMAYLSENTDTLSVSGIALSQTDTGAGDYLLSDYYLQCAGVVNEAYEGGKPASTKPYAIVPGGYSHLGIDSWVAQRSVPSALWFCETSNFSDSANWTTVGDEAFPAVVVSSQQIADDIIASANTANGFYNVNQSYGVYVVPTGLAGSWLAGTPESYLLVPWAYCAFHATNGTIDLSTCTSYVDSFYQTFYRAASGSIVSDYSDGIRSTAT